MTLVGPLAVILFTVAVGQTANQIPPADPAATPPVSVGGVPAAPTPPGPRVTTAVNLDPEHPESIEGWWSNGTQMLEVVGDGAYRLFAAQNRYEKPLELGRWNRQNHAVFWLEPYSARKELRSRVPLSKIDDVTAIQVRTFAPMTHIDAPPLSEEDFVIGLWVGDGGSLDLQPSLRYRFVAPQQATEGQPVVISSHRGAWRLRDGRVELVPDSPSVTPVLFEPIRDAEGKPYMRLRGIEGTLDRVIARPQEPARPESPPEEAKPAVAPRTSI